MSKKAAVGSEVYRCTVAGMAAVLRAKVIIEVGVYGADLSRMFVQSKDLERLVLVDPWRVPFIRFDQAHMDKIASQVVQWAKPLPNVSVLRMTSEDAVKHVEDDTVDFFHTDGDHEYSMVCRDIYGWWPKVKSGGFLTGDNYESAGVAKAVDEIMPERQFSAKGRVWWYQKP